MEDVARARVRYVWAKFKELSPILTAQGASYPIKGKLYKACVQSVLTYEVIAIMKICYDCNISGINWKLQCGSNFS